MTFELNSTIQIADANAVADVLESQLKIRARTVIRTGDSIVAKKFDATWGSGHRNDRTTLEVRSNGRQTIAVARVRYTPSVFFWVCELFLIFTVFAWIFPLLYYFYQKKTVRRAIEEVLLRVKGECEFRSTGPDTLPFKSPPNNAPSQSPHVISWPPPANDTPIQPSTTPDTIASFPQSNDAAVHPDAGPDTAAALQHQDTPPVQRTISQELPPARYEQPPTRSNPTLLVMLGFLGAIALVSTVGWFRTWHTAPAAETTGRPISVEAKEDHPAVPMQSNQTPEVPQSPELQPIPAVEQSPEPSTGTNEPVAVAPPGSPVDQIKSVLDVWVQSMRSGDLNAQMTCYAPMLERYFRSTSVDEPTLRKWKAAGMAKWTSTTFNLSEITYHELQPDRFEVEFHKEWDATGASHFTGASRNVLIFQRIDDAWKIVNEQEPQVYRVSTVPNETSQTPSLSSSPVFAPPMPSPAPPAIETTAYSPPVSKLPEVALAQRSSAPPERVGGDVSPPVLINKVEPEYSVAAHEAKFSGSVLVSLVVDANGLPQEIHVVRPVGLGLDEKAVAAVAQWRFRPGLKSGRPVPIIAQVEVTFRLL